MLQSCSPMLQSCSRASPRTQTKQRIERRGQEQQYRIEEVSLEAEEGEEGRPAQVRGPGAEPGAVLVRRWAG